MNDNETQGLPQAENTVSYSFKNVIKLFTNKHSDDLYERHNFAVKRICKQFGDGFYMHDLADICKVLNLCNERMPKVPEYEEAIHNIIRLCSKPFAKKRYSDELTYKDNVVDIIIEIGKSLLQDNAIVRRQACKTLMKFVTSKREDQDWITSQDYIEFIIIKSEMSVTAISALSVTKEYDILCDLLELTLYLSYSAENCLEMLSAKAPRQIFAILNTDDPSQRILFKSTEIIWNLLELGSGEELAQQLNCITCISELKKALLKLIQSGSSNADRQLRNDLMVIANLIANQNPFVPFVETGLAEKLMLYTTYPEVPSRNMDIRKLKLTHRDEDFEFKKLLFNFISLINVDKTALSLMKKTHIMLGLLSFVRSNDKPIAPWSSAQFEELQLLAMSVLTSIAPQLVDDYMVCQTNARLLLLMEWCTNNDGSFHGHGNSFHGKCSYGNRKAQLRASLRLLLHVCNTKLDIILDDLCDQGAINQLIGMLPQSESVIISDYDVIDIEMQSNILLILSLICESRSHHKELFGQFGVQTVVKYLKLNPNQLSEGLGHLNLLTSAVDNIWCCIVSCPLTEDFFLQEDGVFLLLDLLEICPNSLQNIVLGTILELCDNKKAISHLMTWRGKDNHVTIGSLLVRLWKQEEYAMGVQRDEYGVILDIKNPLAGADQISRGVIPLPSTSITPVIADVFENMRAKIYRLFCKIGFNEISGLNIIDSITVAIIEKYIDFKTGEVHQEIVNELEQEDIRPITPDRECCEEILRTLEYRAKGVSLAQIELLKAQHGQDLTEEQTDYDQLKQNHYYSEKQKSNFKDYVKRTSEMSYLSTAKEKQKRLIDESRVYHLQTVDEDEVDFLPEKFHDTDVPLRTTVLYSNQVSVNTPIIQSASSNDSRQASDIAMSS
ncbi:Cilia- and flagella-associated protein 69 [Trichoplax sp. H2]|nr:Cilia- and flagella-associated protein 69 [Trichoplax sp. H2]|eukprot:RDD38582.1 Cilia- and flagella-associated protein 69 [Trichoplax sp. H2]